MRVLILNGSPRKQGNTAQMVKAFCEGRAAAGHEYDVYEVARNRCEELPSARL